MDGRSKPISMKSIITIECNESHKQICFMRELHGSGNCDIHLGYYVTRKNVFYVCMYVSESQSERALLQVFIATLLLS